MRPRIGLAGSALRGNVRAYAALGVPVSAVIKNDGYGWSAARIVREIDDLVESYVVADDAEFWALRMRTRLPIRLLAASEPATIAAICASGGIPNVTTAAALAAAAAFATTARRRVTVRVGIIDAAGWAGIASTEAAAFAARCVAHDLQIELWTHFTSKIRALDIAQAFDRALNAFRMAGVDIAGTDRASTASVSTNSDGADRVRIGAGLFGARCGVDIATRCAIRVDAPLVQWFPPGALRYAGYGDLTVPPDRGVAVLRCGYGDGLPKQLAGDDDILSIGMQYTARLAENATREHVLIGEHTDLDQLADRLGVGPHELIVGLAQHS